MKNIFPSLALKPLSSYVAIIVIFIHNNVLEKNLECSCKKQTRDCILYFTLPFLIMFFLQLGVDKTFRRTWRHTCRFIWVLLYHTLKAAFIGLLWVVSVLIDGHWYVCCRNDQSDKQKYLACKDKSEFTAEEKQIIAELKNQSWMIGISLLLGALLLAALMSVLRKKCCKDLCCNRKNLFLKVILEEEKDVLKEILTKAAKAALSEAVESKIRSAQWEGCFDVAKDLIKDDSTRPTLKAEEQEQQQDQLRRTDPTQPSQPEAAAGEQVIPLLPVNPGSSDKQ